MATKKKELKSVNYKVYRLVKDTSQHKMFISYDSDDMMNKCKHYFM